MAGAMANLLRLVNIPSKMDAVAIVYTGDSYLLQKRGDIGYNHFLGMPSAPHPGPGRDNMLRVWASLSEDERKAVWLLAAHPMDGQPIPLAKHFGVPKS